MNNVYPINNSKYSFKVGITNSLNRGVVVPLDKGCIEALVIEDTLSFPGLRGYITIANYYGIMQKYEALDFVSGYNILVIDIENLDPLLINANPLRLKLEAILGEAIEVNDNIVDRSITMKFEELNVGLLRTKYFTVDQLNTLSVSTASDYIKQVIKVGLSTENENDIFAKVDNSNIPAPIGGIFNRSQSCYDLVRLFYRNCFYEDGIPSLLTTTPVYEDNNNVIRKFTIRNIGTFFTDFFTKIINSRGVKVVDVSDYLLETFIAGSSKQEDTFADNFIDNYEVYRPDYLDILSNKWVDYNITPSLDFSGVSTGEIFKYEDAKKMFEFKVLGRTFKSNLPPAPPPDALNNATVTVAPPIQEWKDSAKAAIMKSFIYENIAIIFTVKGLPYRQAGYFIQINLDENEDQKKASQDLNGFYYLVSLKHIFNKNAYVNEFVGIKVYLNEDILSPFNRAIANKITDFKNNIDLGSIANIPTPISAISKIFKKIPLSLPNFTGSKSKLSTN